MSYLDFCDCLINSLFFYFWFAEDFAFTPWVERVTNLLLKHRSIYGTQNFSWKGANEFLEFSANNTAGYVSSINKSGRTMCK